jgi:hypothetical protein
VEPAVNVSQNFFVFVFSGRAGGGPPAGEDAGAYLYFLHEIPPRALSVICILMCTHPVAAVMGR